MCCYLVSKTRRQYLTFVALFSASNNRNVTLCCPVAFQEHFYRQSQSLYRVLCVYIRQKIFCAFSYC